IAARIGFDTQTLLDQRQVLVEFAVKLRDEPIVFERQFEMGGGGLVGLRPQIPCQTRWLRGIMRFLPSLTYQTAIAFAVTILPSSEFFACPTISTGRICPIRPLSAAMWTACR